MHVSPAVVYVPICVTHSHAAGFWGHTSLPSVLLFNKVTSLRTQRRAALFHQNTTGGHTRLLFNLETQKVRQSLGFITELHSFQNHRERHLKWAFLQACTPVKDTREKLVEKHYWHLLSNILDEPRRDALLT